MPAAEKWLVFAPSMAPLGSSSNSRSHAGARLPASPDPPCQSLKLWAGPYTAQCYNQGYLTSNMADGAKGKSGLGCCTQSGIACSFINLYVQHQTASLFDWELIDIWGWHSCVFQLHNSVVGLHFFKKNDYVFFHFLHDFPCNSSKLIKISLIIIFI